jgi:ribosomal protein S18 acetylase RimI-like enzyme
MTGNSIGNPVFTIRRLRNGEAELFKQMRLESLLEAPYAFSSTYASALQRSDESWREQAERTVQGSDRATFIAFSDTLPVGIAALYRLDGQEGVGELLQVWVSPECRGAGVAGDLMDAVFQWARENHFQRIIAGVNKENPRALKFYIRYGFTETDLPVSGDAGGVYLAKEVRV